MNQISQALKGLATKETRAVARDEAYPLDDLLSDIAVGHTVILANRLRNPDHSLDIRPAGIGRNLRVKVNANIGTAPDHQDMENEKAKLAAAVVAGADTVMDLSLGKEIIACRRMILAKSGIPVGTVPIYQAVWETLTQGRTLAGLTVDKLFAVIEEHARDGVDFITVHCGLTLEALERLRQQGRITDVVSRGGAMLMAWMIHNQKENPLLTHFERLLDLAGKYDLTLSLGDGLRPGCLADATDRAQIQELIVLGELAARAREARVQVIIEGPGHVPLDQVETNVRIQKMLCGGAPFYVLGPLVTDVAAGHDHIAAAIGGAAAGVAGADFLCCVSPAEHLRLPEAADVREGVVATRIAAHAADLARGHREAWERDLAMAQARKRLDWPAQIELALDSARAGALHDQDLSAEKEACTMCGSFCAMKLVRECLGAGGAA